MPIGTHPQKGQVECGVVTPEMLFQSFRILGGTGLGACSRCGHGVKVIFRHLDAGQQGFADQSDGAIRILMRDETFVGKKRWTLDQSIATE